MSAYDLKLEPGEVIVSIGYLTIKDLKNIYKFSPPSYIEAYEPRKDVYNQYLVFAENFSSFVPRLLAVAGDERLVALNERRHNTTICLPKTKSSMMITTVSLSSVINSVYGIHGQIDKLLMNCEGAEIDIILKTPSEVFRLCKEIIVSFHKFVEEFKISEKTYNSCLNKLSQTHKGELLHKTRFLWRFTLNG